MGEKNHHSCVTTQSWQSTARFSDSELINCQRGYVFKHEMKRYENTLRSVRDDVRSETVDKLCLLRAPIQNNKLTEFGACPPANSETYRS